MFSPSARQAGADEGEVQALREKADVSGNLLTVALCVLAVLITFVFGAIVGAVVAIVGIENQRRLEEESENP